MVLPLNKVSIYLFRKKENQINFVLIYLAQPSPCTGTDGPQSLAFSDKGFIMCDGESMFIESCPGGTVWDDLNKACVWPDMQGVVTASLADQSSKGLF